MFQRLQLALVSAALPAASVSSPSASARRADEGEATWTLEPVDWGTGWRDDGFRLHLQPILRVRSPSASTIEGINRAMLEFVCPTQSVKRVELVLDGRDATGETVVLLGYAGDGQVSPDDAERAATVVATFRVTLGRTVLDVTEFVKTQSVKGVTHAGFRLEFAQESQLPRGLNVRAEWRTNAKLVVYPTCYADCDSESGANVLDAFDFLCFQQGYLARSPYACDCNTETGRGVCDVFDLLCFQRAYLAGCR
jgi:hypothetical protein